VGEDTITIGTIGTITVEVVEGVRRVSCSVGASASLKAAPEGSNSIPPRASASARAARRSAAATAYLLPAHQGKS
jgi:hypothetical protein